MLYMKILMKGALSLSLLLLACFTIQTAKAGVVYSDPLKGQEYSVGFKLSWSTVSEDQAQSFIIERSFDGQNYQEIGSINTKGNANEGGAYEYYDLQLGLSKAQYRLKQVDSDGSFSHSSFINLKKRYVHNYMVTHQEELENGVDEISLESIRERTLSYWVNNQMGDIVVQEEQPLQYGLNTLVVNLEFEAEGQYSVGLKVGNELEMLTVEKTPDQKTKKNVASQGKKGRG